MKRFLLLIIVITTSICSSSKDLLVDPKGDIDFIAGNDSYIDGNVISYDKTNIIYKESLIDNKQSGRKSPKQQRGGKTKKKSKRKSSKKDSRSNTAKNSPRKIKPRYTPNKIAPKRGQKTNMDFDLCAEISCGYTNFVWSGGNSKPGIGFGAGISGLLFFKSIDATPKGYFTKIGLGYSRRGSGAYPIDYAQIKLFPLGYAYPINRDMAIMGKLGGYAAFPFSKIKTELNSYNTKFDFGIIGGIGVAYDKIGLMVSYEHGFDNVSEANVNLKNHCVFFTLSYKLF